MKKIILPLLAIASISILINHFIDDKDSGERVSLSKSAQTLGAEQAKFEQMGYAERNITLNKKSELDARKAEFNFENPCAKKELFVTMDGISFVNYKKQALTAFTDHFVEEKLNSAQGIISNMRILVDDLNHSDIDSKLFTISENIEKIVVMQNYFAQEILKKLPQNNDFSYLIAQRTIEDTIPIELPLSVLMFCKTHINSGCDSVRNQMKKAVDSDSLLFANNIDRNIYFSNTERQDNLDSDRMVCKADIHASKLALENRFSELYAQNMTDNINSAKLSPFNF